MLYTVAAYSSVGRDEEPQPQHILTPPSLPFGGVRASWALLASSSMVPIILRLPSDRLASTTSRYISRLIADDRTEFYAIEMWSAPFLSGWGNGSLTALKPILGRQFRVIPTYYSMFYVVRWPKSAALLQQWRVIGGSVEIIGLRLFSALRTPLFLACVLRSWLHSLASIRLTTTVFRTEDTRAAGRRKPQSGHFKHVSDVHHRPSSKWEQAEMCSGRVYIAVLSMWYSSRSYESDEMRIR